MKYPLLLLFISLCHSCAAQPATEAEAIKFLETAQAVYETGDNNKLSQSQIDDLGLAIDFFGQDKGKYLLQWGKCLYLRANQYYILLNETKALDDIFRAVDGLTERAETDEHYKLIGECYNLAQIVYTELLFNLDQTRAMLDFSLEYYEKAGHHYGVAESCLNGAFGLTRLGRCKLAEQYFRRGVEVMEQHKGENFGPLPYYMIYAKGAVHLCLAEALYFDGEISRVGPQLQLARENFHSIAPLLQPGPEKMAVHFSLGSTFISFDEWRNLDSAAYHLNQVLEVFSDSPFIDEYLYTLWINFPRFYEMANETPDALLRFVDSTDRDLPISIFTPTEEALLNAPYRKRISYANSLTHIGVVFQYAYENTKDIRILEAALKIYRSFIKVAFFNRFVLATDASIEAYDNRYSEVFPSAVHLALRLCEITGEEAYREEAFQISEQSKSFALKRHLHHAFSAPQYGGEQRALWEREEALRQDINKLEAEYLRTQDTLFLSQAARKRVELWAFIQGLQDGNASGQRYYTERFDTDVPSIQEIQQSLGAEEALIEFDVSLSQNLAFVITRGGVQVVRLKGLKEHAALIDEFDDLLRNNGARFDSVSHRLYQKIFEPIKKALPDGIRHLIIVPDHKYWKINFDALAVQAQPREYLLEDHVISYSYSAAILHQLAKARESRRKKGHLGFFFGGYPEKDSLPSLDSLERKADSLSRALNMAKAYPEASSQHFAGALGDLDAAVLAVHGELGGRGDISGIHLVFPAAERRLFIQEAYGLPMEGFHFLFLAVCDGAWGNFSRGEGISSIARAFHYAGCPNLIAAQMKARDDPSADLMASFFKYLNEGFTYAEALKKAKVDTMKKANFRSPIYWAPFICIGDGFSRYR